MSFKLSTYVTLKDKFRSVVKTSSFLISDSNSNSICMDTQKQFDIAGKQIELLQDIFADLDASSDYSDEEKAKIITGALITTKRKSENKNYKSYIETIDIVLGVDENNKLSKSEALTYKNVYIKYKENNKVYKFSHAYYEFLPLTDLEKQFIELLREELKPYQQNTVHEQSIPITQTKEQIEAFVTNAQIESLLKNISNMNESLVRNKKHKTRNEIIKKLQTTEFKLYPRSIVIEKGNRPTSKLLPEHQREILKQINKLTFCNSSIFSARLITPPQNQRKE